MGCLGKEALHVMIGLAIFLLGGACSVFEASGTDSWEHADGLSVNFYKDSCPRAYEIIKNKVKDLIHQNPSEAAGILRIHFHDCFVQGCDSSILLHKPTTEQTATPNNASLRVSSLRALEEIKEALEDACPDTVSCADIIALSAATAVHLVGGPKIEMATGRRDSQSAASNQTVTAQIPPPVLNISALKQNFQRKGLGVADLVALSGAHTIGQAHCKIVDLQLSPNISTDLKPQFAANLSRICLSGNSSDKSKLTVHLDFISSDMFDNSYFKNVLNKVAMFHTDATLLNATDTKQLVEQYANSQEKFFDQFKVSMVKMSEISVLTGSKGVIRKKCTHGEND